MMMMMMMMMMMNKITELSFIISAYSVQNLMPLNPPAFLSAHLQNTEWIFMICAVNLNQKLCLFWLENWYSIIPILEETIIRQHFLQVSLLYELCSKKKVKM